MTPDESDTAAADERGDTADTNNAGGGIDFDEPFDEGIDVLDSDPTPDSEPATSSRRADSGARADVDGGEIGTEAGAEDAAEGDEAGDGSAESEAEDADESDTDDTDGWGFDSVESREDR
nr:hypothetical protein [Halorubrum saccharovorum]